MKKIIFLLAFFVNACTLIDEYQIKFDLNQYRSISDIRTSAEIAKTKCEDTSYAAAQANQIYANTVSFKNYVQYLPHVGKIADASSELSSIAKGLNDQYQTGKVSTTFCRIKFENIQQSAEIIQKIIGSEPK